MNYDGTDGSYDEQKRAIVYDRGTVAESFGIEIDSDDRDKLNRMIGALSGR